MHYLIYTYKGPLYKDKKFTTVILKGNKFKDRHNNSPKFPWHSSAVVYAVFIWSNSCIGTKMSLVFQKLMLKRENNSFLVDCIYNRLLQYSLIYIYFLIYLNKNMLLLNCVRPINLCPEQGLAQKAEAFCFFTSPPKTIMGSLCLRLWPFLMW